MPVNSKSKGARHKRLLGAGFLPEELPTPFNSQDLAKFRNALQKKFNAIPNLKNGEPWFYTFRSNASPIYFPRFGKQDRKHFILNPVNFFFLSGEIANNWLALRKILARSKISASKQIFDWGGGRALLPINFGERSKRIADISVRNNVLVKSDVARFYHSIYTHSLAWAVHGKATAKKNHSNALLGNRLDLLSRNSQDGQTIGVPVGPETSRILAELVGAAIDAKLAENKDFVLNDCSRFVDDFAFGVSSREEAERKISFLRRVVHEFELEINEEKTGVENVFQLDYASWRQELQSLRPGFGANQNVFERFFDQINALARLHPHDNVLRYAIKVSRAIFVGAKPWPSIEDFLLLAYRANPSVVQSVVEIIANRHRHSKDVDLKKVSNFIASNVERLSETEKHGELAWLLFLASQLSISIKSSHLERLFQLNCPVPALHVCHMHSLGLITKSIDRKFWNQSLNAGGLTSEMWLYAYEASLKGWTAGGSWKFIAASPAFSPLWQKNISFFDAKATSPDVGDSSKKDMFLSLKIKSAVGKAVNFDFDDSEESDEQDDHISDWSEY